MHTRWSRLSSLFTLFLTHEQDRLILWTPVLLGLGIAAYFSLTFEPPFWWALGAALCAGGCVGTVVLTYYRAFFVLHVTLLGLACVCLGFSAALWRTQTLATPMLNTHVKRATLEGVIENVTYLRYKGGPQAVKGARVIVRVTRIVPTLALRKVRLWIPCGWKTLRTGQHIRVKANLTKLPPPTWPYGYDMRRTCYFQGIGAKGFCLTSPSLRHTPPPLWRTMWMEPWRERLTHVLFEVLPMPHASVAAALLTGHTAGLPSSLRADFADAGMAHLLAISGLHMSIVAGLVFFMVYSLLGLWQRAVLFWPLHKMAAVATMLGTFLYLHLSGVHIPATRSFFMTTMAMTALLLDRSPLSLRLVAFSATLILILRPENLLSPSFQLSFAAVTSLVAVFEQVKTRAQPYQHWFYTGLSWLGISLLSTVIAGLATLPFTAATFHQATLLGMVANLVAIPLTTFVVMPLGIALILCSLVSLASWVAPLLTLALSGLIAIAHTVASWPMASVTVPAGAPWALGLITLSGLWMLLWKTRLRWLGAPLLLGGFWALWTPHPPHIFMESEGKCLAYFESVSNTLWASSLRKGRFALDTWQKVTGATTLRTLPFQRPEAPWLGNTHGCFQRTPHGLNLLLAHSTRHLPFCGAADIVCALEPLRFRCDGGHQKLRLDRFSVWREGSVCVWLASHKTFRKRSCSDLQGQRPWTYRPPLHKKRAHNNKKRHPPHHKGRTVFVKSRKARG